jgi:hypothetical protein
MNLNMDKMKPTPYTYLIGWSEQNLYYYGVRYANNCYPSDLLVTYFTSSKYINKYIKQFGDPDVVQIRKTFNNKIAAKFWEDKVLRRINAASNLKFINKSNNNSFKGVIMDDDIISKISESRLKKSKKYKIYNNGIENIRIHVNELIPEGYVAGKILTEKQKDHVEYFCHNYNRLTEEEKQQRNTKLSLRTKGVKKPPQHGANVSKALTGIKRPQFIGANNPSYTPEARKKISDSHKTRKHIVWFYDPETLNATWFYNDDLCNIPVNLKRGKPPLGIWYNDGINNVWVRKNSGVDISYLQLGKIKIKYFYITNGIESKQIQSLEEIPIGWYRGRTQKTNKMGVY